jgi:hypothetical protein
MLYMVIERFKNPGAIEIYGRARDNGRMVPAGLEYVASWVDLDFTRCFHLMRTNDERLLKQWSAHWEDLVEFEFIPVRTSREATRIIAPNL